MSALVLIKNDRLITSSTLLAEAFGMRHADALRKIDAILAETQDEFTQRNFALSEYIDSTGRSLRSYDMTRDGFMHIALTFTGNKGNAFRVAVINAFNEAERRLAKPASDLPTMLEAAAASIRIAEARAIEAERTKAHISDKKTATALARTGHANRQLRLAVDEVQELKRQLGQAENFKTVVGWLNSEKYGIRLKELGFHDRNLGQAAGKEARALGIKMEKVPGANFPVNLIPVEVIERILALKQAS